MSTDKTLADVQPGGRVRLGDALPPLPAPNYPVSKTGLQNNAYTASQMTDYARAALSAQPSPGGQDALDCIGRIEEAIEFRVPHDIYAAVHGELAELKAALAARQPVVVDLPESLHDRVEALREVAARQPVELIAQKVGDYRVTVAEDAITVSRGRDIVFAYSAGDPEPINASQPVGEPFAYGSSAGHQPIPASVYYPDNEACRELYDIPLYAAPPAQPVGEAVELARAKVKIAALELQLATYEAPAQAVDLERFRGTVKSQYSMTEWMHRCGFVSAEKLEESKKNHDHLLALIDSKAVGK